MIRQLLDPYRSRKNWTIDDLVHAAAEIIPLVAGPQERHKVTEVPDARTVRYYIQEGLVDRPLGSAGPAAIYGYRHLLQLAAIKVLQSRYLPIRRIRGEIKDLSDGQIEERLEAWTGAPAVPAAPHDVEPLQRRGDAARLFLESLRARASAAPPAQRPDLAEKGAASAPRSAWSRTRLAAPARVDSPSRLRRQAESPDPEDAPIVYASASMSAEPPPASGWRRFELFPGIELHVKEEIEVPEGPSFLSVLASRLRVILEGLRSAKSKDTNPRKPV